MLASSNEDETALTFSLAGMASVCSFTKGAADAASDRSLGSLLNNPLSIVFLSSREDGGSQT